MFSVHTNTLKPVINHEHASLLTSVATFMAKNTSLKNKTFSSLKEMLHAIRQMAVKHQFRFLNAKTNTATRIPNLKPDITTSCTTTIPLIPEPHDIATQKVAAYTLKTYLESTAHPEINIASNKPIESQLMEQLQKHIYPYMNIDVEYVEPCTPNGRCIELPLTTACFDSQQYFDMESLTEHFTGALQEAVTTLLVMMPLTSVPAHSYMYAYVESLVDEHDPDNYADLDDAAFFFESGTHFMKVETPTLTMGKDHAIKIIFEKTKNSKNAAFIAIRELAQACLISIKDESKMNPWEYLEESYGGQGMGYPEIILCPDSKCYEFCEYYTSYYNQEQSGILVASFDENFEHPAKEIARDSIIIKNLNILNELEKAPQ